jgi:dipeptidyl aminopeptidase/acylaminoacyl peptidase
LVNRGYAVLSVNYRESTGFGKNFTNDGNLEWGKKMQDDLIDAVNWSIKQGIADPQKIAIMGGSYGGYATLAGLTFTPRLFSCGVDICGPSNLTSLFESVPAYWLPQMELWTSREGDYRTKEGRELLKVRSPINYADKIQRPLLIGQGANDPRVRQNESDQIVNVMHAKNLSVTYVIYSDEGHGFARPENKISFFAVAEAFLAKHLGGRYEPIGTDFNGSTIAVPTGAAEVPGLVEALQKKL